MTKLQNVIVLLMSTILFISCGQKASSNKGELINVSSEKLSLLQPLTQKEGLTALSTNCYSCHNPKSESHDDILAPPLAGIKYRYLKEYADRSAFITQMADYIQQPSMEKALMKGPVRRFGLMPVSPLEKEEIKKIVAFIYDNRIEAPVWFAEHFEEQHGKKWE